MKHTNIKVTWKDPSSQAAVKDEYTGNYSFSIDDNKILKIYESVGLNWNDPEAAYQSWLNVQQENLIPIEGPDKTDDK